jgi:predicted DNA-binding transcriptional regulator AlpA
MNQLPETGFLRLPQILGDAKRGIPPIIPIKKTCWWNGVKSGRFPQPVKFGQRVTAWRVEDIRAFIAAQ